MIFLKKTDKLIIGPIEYRYYTCNDGVKCNRCELTTFCKKYYANYHKPLCFVKCSNNSGYYKAYDYFEKPR